MYLAILLVLQHITLVQLEGDTSIDICPSNKHD